MTFRKQIKNELVGYEKKPIVATYYICEKCGQAFSNKKPKIHYIDLKRTRCK